MTGEPSEIANPSPEDMRVAMANIRELWSALDLVWQALEQEAVGLLPSREHVPPEPLKYAELLVAAIHKLCGERGRRTIPVEP